MTKRHDASFFERLTAPMLRHLRYIAKLTQGEHTVDDLKSEAWIIAEEIKAERAERSNRRTPIFRKLSSLDSTSCSANL
ncbi:hypothetical protein [Burkholderia cenocepacia]|uniref:hypothetical protein n=1 Tax=Burkholderia cenocepacia TaxID=95486 RepID=UPI000ACFEB6E|nr:hypothetical protein [Burkholderia cenocepacia]